MWNDFVLFMNKMTILNWGMTYHFIIAQNLITVPNWIFQRYNKRWLRIIAPVVYFLLVLYEVLQFAQGNNNSMDFAGDMMANSLGTLFAVWLAQE